MPWEFHVYKSCTVFEGSKGMDIIANLRGLYRENDSNSTMKPFLMKISFLVLFCKEVHSVLR